ncbi:MAG: serine hydrolase domain-containing protein [bacterium]
MKEISIHTRLRVQWFLILFLAGIIFLHAPALALSLSEKVDQTFKKWNTPNSPGCAIAVVKDGQIIYEKGYGMADLRHGVPLTPNTVFHFGSNSKQFTAFSIFLLEEEGWLQLTDDFHQYIPELPDFGKTITIQHLLDHTSGLRDYLELLAFAGWNYMDDLITKDLGFKYTLRQKALNFDPGEQFMYSNTGFMLLAEIVARISGQTFAQFTQERIFTPLGMTNSQFVDNHHVILKNFASSYTPPVEGVYYEYPVNFASVGEGGLYSTVEDLVKWDQNFYDATIGSGSILDKMHQKGILNNGQLSTMSAGLIVTYYKGRRLVYHGGDIAGYHSQIVRFPDEQFSIITASNTAEMDSIDLANKSVSIADFYFANPDSTEIPDFLIHEPSLRGLAGTGEPAFYAPDLDFASFWNPFRRIPPRKPSGSQPQLSIPQMTAAEAEEYTGRYYSEELDSFITIAFDGVENLLFQITRSAYPYMFSVKTVNNNAFVFNESNLNKGIFLRNPLGEVTGFRISSSRVLDLEFRKGEIVTKE